MPLIDDMESEVAEPVEREETDAGSEAVITEAFSHLGKTFSDEHPRDPDDDY